mmetsp:Transcript_15030/g.31532  ORF Transcript_15030/g.31532 Transcript_15030/m.31532 type:complete len:167 (-) Transcript_15030:407-907(-)
MGNRSSSPSNTSQEEEPGSGVYLTKDLQVQINNDFESHILNTEWNKYRSLFLQRHQERATSESLRQAEMQQKIEELGRQAKLVNDKLDETIDAIKSKMVDLQVEVDYDVKRLSDKFEGDVPPSEGKCLDTRAELARCYNTLSDSKECQVFAQKLEKCVTELLAASQ